MAPKRIVIIGAGVSGLSVAWGLCGRKNFEVTLLERGQNIGGLSRTIRHDGIYLDIGPHRFSPQLPKAVKLVRKLLGKDLVARQNLHGVYFNGLLYNYPPRLIDFFHLSSLINSFIFGSDWVFGKFLEGINKVLGKPRGKSFESILYKQFGRSFSNKVIFPMISKVWGTKELCSEFANIRFLKPTFARILGRIFLKNSSLNDSVFYYPVKGYGEICERIGEYLKKNSQRLESGVNIESIEAKSLKGPFKIIYTQGSETKSIDADILVSTISNKDLIGYFSSTGLVKDLVPYVDKFISRTLRLGVIAIKNFHLPVRVIIFPEAKFIFNRMSEMNLFSDLGYPEGQAILMVDVICDEGSAYDVMNDEEFNKYLLDSVLTLGWFKKTDVCRNFNIRFPKAYPILDEGRYKAQEKVNSYFENSGIILCGREASSDYNNAHNAMIKGFITANYISGDINLREYKRSSNLMGRLPIQD